MHLTPEMGRQLWSQRTTLGKTQREVAREAGVSGVQISRMEKGGLRVSDHLFRAVQEALRVPEVPPDDLEYESFLDAMCREEHDDFLWPRCGSCAFYSGDGFCLRRPPVVILDNHGDPYSHWPEVGEDSYCGEGMHLSKKNNVKR